MPQEDDEEFEDENKPIHLTGGTTKFKMEHSERCWPQAFANMTRIANLLVVQCLECGYLVASVRVYGLLADYKQETVYLWYIVLILKVTHLNF